MLFYLSLFGFFVAGLLYLNSRKKFTGNYYLVGFYLINSLNSMAIYSTFFGDSAELVAIVQIHFMSVYYLAGPFMFFYVRSLVDDDPRLYKTDLWHFLPFMILTIGVIPYTLKPFEYKLDVAHRILQDGKVLFENYNVLVPQKVNIIFRWAYYLGYFVYALWYYWRNRTEKIHREITSDVHKRRLDAWILVLLSTSIIITAVLLWLTVDSYLSNQFNTNVKEAAILLYTMAIAYIVLNFSLFVFPEILYGYPHSKSSDLDADLQRLHEHQSSGIDTKGNDVNVFEEHPAPITQTVDGIQVEPANRLKMLTEEYLRLVEKRIARAVHEDLYLKKDFSMLSLSEHTHIPIHHLSYYLNYVLHKKFNVWRNELRIAHARELIARGMLHNMTLAALSDACGYASQATFISSFKSITGTTPSGFFKSRN
jgi:AraC-like DNA-binding protein